MTILTYLKFGAVIALVLIVGVHFADDALTRARLKTATGAWASWQAYGQAEKRAYDAQVAARAAEATTAAGSANAQAKVCTAYVAEARRSAAAITQLVNQEPAHDPQTGCPARELMDARQLYDALKPPAQASAPG